MTCITWPNSRLVLSSSCTELSQTPAERRQSGNVQPIDETTRDWVGGTKANRWTTHLDVAAKLPTTSCTGRRLVTLLDGQLLTEW